MDKKIGEDKKKGGLSNGSHKYKKQKMGNRNIKIFSFSINPFLLIGIIIFLSIFVYQLLNRDTSLGNEVSIEEFVVNIKKNNYSQVNIRDDGKSVGVGKGILVASKEDLETESLKEKIKEHDTDFLEEETENGKFSIVNIEEFIEALKPLSVDEVFRSLWGSENLQVGQIIFGDDFVIGKRVNADGRDLLLKDVSRESLESSLESEGLTIEGLNIEIKDFVNEIDGTSYETFSKLAEDGNFSDIWIVNGDVIGLRIKESVVSEYVDWTALTVDFARFLQEEGVDFESSNVKISAVRVPSPLDFGSVIQLLMFVFVIFLLFTLIRGINGTGNRFMQFGESKAKIFFGRKPEVTFKDVAGIDNAKEELNEVVMFLKDPKRFLNVGARIPKGLLMVGPPGTGKTLLAKAIAGEARVPFFHTSGSEFEEMLVGAGASRVRDLFGKARKSAPALIFIDEIDAVARKRGTNIQSSSTEQTLNQILVEMDGFTKNTNVIVIAATNRPDVLDPAILRPGRFDRRIVIDLPDIKGREEILRIHAKNKPLARSANLTKIARRTVGYSGADLENMLNEAAIIIAKEGRREIEYKDIEEAASRVGMGRERKISRTKEEIKKTAYHEAGHAIVARLTPESDPVHRITIVSRGMALGVTMQLPERDKYSQSYTEMESRLKVLMGGRAAEEIIYGAAKITSGASNDIEKSTSMARRMVKEFGYSKKLGLVKYGDGSDSHLGYSYDSNSSYSDKTAAEIDSEVKEIIAVAYEGAIRILNSNKDLLERVASDLIEKEVMDGEEFEKYFSK